MARNIKRKMGSIEVYDYQQQKWVPYVPDPEAWYQHFKDVRDGYAQPDHKGRYIVGSGKKHRKLAESKVEQPERPIVNIVSPVAQAVEIAKSEVKRSEKRSNSSLHRKEMKRLKVYDVNALGRKKRDSIDWKY